MKFNKLFGIFSSLLISLFSYPSNQNLNFNYLNCGECFDCCDHEHSHNHKIEELIVGNDLNTNAIYDIPSSIIFATSTLNSKENYGEVTIQANYEPEGCLADSIWESSDETKITVTPDDSDSSICKLTCIAPFDDEVTITVKSLYFPSLSHSIKVTYDYGIVISAKVTSVTLSGKYNYNCDGSSITLGDEFDKELLSDIFSVSDSSLVSYSVPTGSDYAGISGSYLVQSSRSSYSSGIVRCYQTNNPSNYVDVNFSTTSTTYSRSHSYSTTSSATCTSSGKKTCSNCGDIVTISALGHSYGSWSSYSNPVVSSENEATCTEDGYTRYMKYRTRTCWRCGDKDYDYEYYNEDYVDALGHSYTDKEYSYTAYSAAQHTKYTYDVCSRCGERDSGSTSVKEDHTISGSWSYYTVTYHRKTGTCTDCGRSSSYVQATHSYTGKYCYKCKGKLNLLGSSGSSATYKCSSCSQTYSFTSSSTPDYYTKCECGHYKLT